MAMSRMTGRISEQKEIMYGKTCSYSLLNFHTFSDWHPFLRFYFAAEAKSNIVSLYFRLQIRLNGFTQRSDLHRSNGVKGTLSCMHEPLIKLNRRKWIPLELMCVPFWFHVRCFVSILLLIFCRVQTNLPHASISTYNKCIFSFMFFVATPRALAIPLFG